MKALAFTVASIALALCAAPKARAQVAAVTTCSGLSIPAQADNAKLFEDLTGVLCGLPGGSGIVGTVKPDASISTGYQQLTSLATSTSFTPPATTTFCVIMPEGAPIRFRADGVAPTATVGFPLSIGQPVTFRMSIANLAAIAFIQQSSGGIINVSCFKDA